MIINNTMDKDCTCVSTADIEPCKAIWHMQRQDDSIPVNRKERRKLKARKRKNGIPTR